MNCPNASFHLPGADPRAAAAQLFIISIFLQKASVCAPNTFFIARYLLILVRTAEVVHFPEPAVGPSPRAWRPTRPCRLPAPGRSGMTVRDSDKRGEFKTAGAAELGRSGKTHPNGIKQALLSELARSQAKNEDTSNRTMFAKVSHKIAHVIAVALGAAFDGMAGFSLIAGAKSTGFLAPEKKKQQRTYVIQSPSFLAPYAAARNRIRNRKHIITTRFDYQLQPYRNAICLRTMRVLRASGDGRALPHEQIGLFKKRI